MLEKWGRNHIRHSPMDSFIGTHCVRRPEKSYRPWGYWVSSRGLAKSNDGYKPIGKRDSRESMLSAHFAAAAAADDDDDDDVS